MDYFHNTRDKLLEIQPSLQKLVTVELPMDEALHVVQLIEKVNPILCNDNIKEVEIEKIEVSLAHDVKLTPLDLKLLSELINFKEVGI